MKTRNKRLAALWVPLLIGFFSTSATAGIDDMSVDINPLFEGVSPGDGVIPLTVKIENKGNDARGILRVSSANFFMDYPVELPKGSLKRIITYPQVNSQMGSDPILFTLDTNQGRANFRFLPELGSSFAQYRVILVTDSPGEMAFLRAQTRGTGRRNNPFDENSIRDGYFRPGSGPDRPVAYQGVNTVVLGSGAERLTDAEVHGIKLWLLSGGTVVFVGGASAPILNDPRWRDVLPVRSGQPKTISGSKLLSSYGSQTLNGPLTVTAAQPAEGARVEADSGVAMVARRACGLGRSVFIAYNPFEAPISRWPGRRSAFVRSLDLSQAYQKMAYLSQFDLQMDPYNRSYYYGGTGGAYYPGYEEPQANDPFSTELPPTSRVFNILAAYFVVVVPINFLVLRKLRRGELAWLTSPIISLAFAGIFLASAGDLYSAKLSTATKGLLLAREGFEEGIFVGNSQMFFPRGGDYDLKMVGVDQLGTGVNMEDYYGAMGSTPPSNQMEDMSPVDSGSINIKSMSTTNLAFKEFSYRQRVPTKGWFDIKIVSWNRGRGKVQVTNRSPYAFGNARLVVSGADYPIPELQPGKTHVVEISGNPAIGRVPPRGNGAVVRTTWDNASSLTPLTASSGAIALVGDMRGLRPGPQIGQEVSDRSSIRVAYFAEECWGGARG